jgi:hypothetical protein
MHPHPWSYKLDTCTGRFELGDYPHVLRRTEPVSDLVGWETGFKNCGTFLHPMRGIVKE